MVSKKLSVNKTYRFKFDTSDESLMAYAKFMSEAIDEKCRVSFFSTGTYSYVDICTTLKVMKHLATDFKKYFERELIGKASARL